MKRDGYIVDNPKIGPDMTKSYWVYGNSRPFLDLVKDLTGIELSGDAWVKELKQEIEEVVASEKKDYDKSIAGYSEESAKENPDLGMIVRFVDGDKLISDSSTATGGVLGACSEFESFVQERLSK
jgi:hypothetical protein